MADNKNFSNDHKLDQLLDQTLADYSNVEPRAGLEDRILANLDCSGDSAQAEMRSWLRWWPAFSFAGAAVIALVIYLAMPHATPKPTQVVLVPPTTAPTSTPAINTSRQPRVASATHLQAAGRAAHQTAASKPQPPRLAVMKQDVFPAPSPLTEQEHLLFSYMRRTPVAEIAANAKPDPPPAPGQQINDQQINQVLPGQRTNDSNTNTR